METFIPIVLGTIAALALLFGGALLVRRWLDRRDLKPLLGVASPPEEYMEND